MGYRESFETGEVDRPIPPLLDPCANGNSAFHGARPVYQNHLHDLVDSDQEVSSKELSLCSLRAPVHSRARITTLIGLTLGALVP